MLSPLSRYLKIQGGNYLHKSTRSVKICLKVWIWMIELSGLHTSLNGYSKSDNKKRSTVPSVCPQKKQQKKIKLWFQPTHPLAKPIISLHSFYPLPRWNAGRLIAGRRARKSTINFDLPVVHTHPLNCWSSRLFPLSTSKNQYPFVGLREASYLTCSTVVTLEKSCRCHKLRSKHISILQVFGVISITPDLPSCLNQIAIKILIPKR